MIKNKLVMSASALKLNISQCFIRELAIFVRVFFFTEVLTTNNSKGCGEDSSHLFGCYQAIYIADWQIFRFRLGDRLLIVYC